MKFAYLLLSICLLSSCIGQKYVYKHNILYDVEGAPNTAVHVKEVTRPFPATIEPKGDLLVVKPAQGIDVSRVTYSTTDTPAEAIPAAKLLLNRKLYFPETDLVTDNNKKDKLKYFDTKPVFQALTIPLRIRPKLDRSRYLDSFPQQAETGVNVGLSFGWKFSHNIYNVNKNILGQNLNSYSLIPGIFLGLSTADLSKAKTRNPSIDFDRKAAAVTAGGYLMMGINNINLGIAWGTDFATGNGHRQWVYQGKGWYGVIVALDLIK